MSTIATTNFKTLSAKSFVNSIQNEDNLIYAFFGRSQPWLNETFENTPISSNDYQFDYFTADRDIIALKRVTPQNICHVIPRKNWTPYKVYDQWDDKDAEIWEKDFYVMNSEYAIYKCLRTPVNRTTGERIQSTEEPNHIPPYNVFGTIDLSEDPKQYDDGYIWKFMYKLSELDMKFLTFDYMPIRYYNPSVTYTQLTETEKLNADIQEASLSLDGRIYSYIVSNGGLNYSSNTILSIYGDGTSASASIYTNSNGRIITVEVEEDTSGDIIGEGSGYHYANSIVTDIGGGAGASIFPIISPPNGHGSNPVEELGSYFVCVSSEFFNNEFDTDVKIDTVYRQLGLIENPQLNLSTSNLSDNLNGCITLNVVLSNTVNSINNLQYIYDADGSKIAFIDGVETLSNDSSGVTVELRVHRTNDTIYVDFDDSVYSDLYLENSVDPFGSIVSVTDPEYVHFTGNILFLENRSPITRNPNQIEQVRFVVEF
jgi:hypothetical protein